MRSTQSTPRRRLFSSTALALAFFGCQPADEVATADGAAPSTTPDASADATTGPTPDASPDAAAPPACGDPLTGTAVALDATREASGISQFDWRLDRQTGEISARLTAGDQPAGELRIVPVAPGALHDHELTAEFTGPDGRQAALSIRGLSDAPGAPPNRQQISITLDDLALRMLAVTDAPTRWSVEAPPGAPPPSSGAAIASGDGLEFFLHSDDPAEIEAWLREVGRGPLLDDPAVRSLLGGIADGALYRAVGDQVQACAAAANLTAQFVDDVHSPLGHCQRIDACGPVLLVASGFSIIAIPPLALSGILVPCINDAVKCVCAADRVTASPFCDPCLTEAPCAQSCPGEFGECRARDEAVEPTASSYAGVVDCVCRDADWCERHRCNCVFGCIFGDPHMISLDGLAYDMQGAGEYILARSADGVLEVQVRLTPGEGCEGFSRTAVLATRLGEVRLRVHGRGDVLADADGAALDFGVHRIGGGVVYVSAGRVVVEGPSGDTVIAHRSEGWLDAEVRPLAKRRGTLTGLLGDWNGDPADDLRPAGAEPLPQTADWQEVRDRFAATWRVTDEASLLPYAEGETTATYTDPTFPPAPVSVESLDDAARTAASETCEAAGVTEPTHLARCLVDVACSGPGAADWYIGAPPPVAVAGPVPVDPAVEACQRTGDALGVEDGVPMDVDCPACADVAYGTVYGTNVYTADSAVCPAAIHAGAIPPAGGRARVVFGPGQDAYPGSTQNGITTSEWGFYARSFSFVPAGP